MFFVLLSTNVLVVGKTGKVLLTFPLYFLQIGNQIFCSVYIRAGEIPKFFEKPPSKPLNGRPGLAQFKEF